VPYLDRQVEQFRARLKIAGANLQLKAEQVQSIGAAFDTLAQAIEDDKAGGKVTAEQKYQSLELLMELEQKLNQVLES
jgi:hypothetical protein